MPMVLHVNGSEYDPSKFLACVCWLGSYLQNSNLLQDRIWAKNRVEFVNGLKCSSGNSPIGLNIDRNWFWYPKLSKILNL